jgi:hypothetical protein
MMVGQWRPAELTQRQLASRLRQGEPEMNADLAGRHLQLCKPALRKLKLERIPTVEGACEALVSDEGAIALAARSPCQSSLHPAILPLRWLTRAICGSSSLHAGW